MTKIIIVADDGTTLEVDAGKSCGGESTQDGRRTFIFEHATVVLTAPKKAPE